MGASNPLRRWSFPALSHILRKTTEKKTLVQICADCSWITSNVEHIVCKLWGATGNSRTPLISWLKLVANLLNWSAGWPQAPHTSVSIFRIVVPARLFNGVMGHGSSKCSSPRSFVCRIEGGGGSFAGFCLFLGWTHCGLKVFAPVSHQGYKHCWSSGQHHHTQFILEYK